MYYDDQKLYSTDSAFYVCGSEDPMVLEAVDYFSFTVLAGKYVAEMVSMMSDLYRRVDVIVKDIDSMGDSSVYSREHLKTLRGSIIETDFIRRECSERYGKIQQATKNFQHKREAYLGEKFGGSSAEIAPHLRVEDAFKRLESDSDYLVPLWRDVLINNLENLSFAVNARINFQESLETQKEQKEVRLLRHITVLALAAAVLKLGNQQGFNPVDMIVYGLLAIILSGIIIFVIEYFSGSFRRR